jgi:alanine dehydrogenase
VDFPLAPSPRDAESRRLHNHPLRQPDHGDGADAAARDLPCRAEARRPDRPRLRGRAPDSGSARVRTGREAFLTSGAPPRDPETILLGRRDVALLLSLPECIDAVEEAFRLHARGKSLPPAILGVRAENGGFHVKAAGLKLDGRSYFAAKTNANFPGNRDRFGLPTIQGIVLLFDAENGIPVAVLDSIEITILRTGAATAVAAKRLARPDSRTVTVAGCGEQGRVQLAALMNVLPVERVRVFDADPDRARRFADERSRELTIPVEAVTDLAAAVRSSDACVTCTPSRQPLVWDADVRDGTFLAAVGADSADKQELDPRILARAKVVADSLDQCVAIGDLHHAVAAGLVKASDVHAELADVVDGRKPGRESAAEVTVFDSTGTALQDVAAAVAVYEKALASGRGTRFRFSA